MDLEKLARKYPKCTVVWYKDGFVALAYHWPAPGQAITYTYNPATDSVVQDIHHYDRKRSHGCGARVVLHTEKGGTLRNWSADD